MKRCLPLLSVLVLPLAMAACSSGGGGGTSAATTPPATSSLGSASPSPSTTTATSGSGSGSGSSTSTSSTGTTTTAAGSTSRCHSGDLSLKMGTGGGAAGTDYQNLVFTNKSGHTCTLYGYPGVSWVAGDNGAQVNDPFERSGGAKRTITLKNGGVAHAVLASVNAGNFDASKCKPVNVRGYRIYPPNETASIFVSDPQDVCSVKGVGLGRVQPITSGPGTEG